MTDNTNLAAIREMLDVAFSAGEIATLAFDLFQPVYRDFTSGMTKSQRIEMIVAHAHSNGRIPALLDYVRQKNPYQYEAFAGRIARPAAEEPVQESAMNTFQETRLRDLQRNIKRERQLLKEYEELESDVRDPRERRRYQREIDRQKETIARYQKEASEIAVALGLALTAESPDAEADAGGGDQISVGNISGGSVAIGRGATVIHVQPADRDKAGAEAVQQLLDAINALSQQVSGAEARLVAEHAATRAQMARQTEAILAHFDAGQRDTVAQLLARLDANQIDLVQRLETAAAQQEIEWREARQLSHELEMTLAELAERHAGQPTAAQYESLLATLEASASWQQKLKLTLPLIPGILAVESEMGFDALGALEQAWQRLSGRFRRDTQA